MKKNLLLIAIFTFCIIGQTRAQKYAEYSEADRKIMDASPANSRISSFIYALDRVEGQARADGNIYNLEALNRDMPDFIELYGKMKKDDPKFTILDGRYNKVVTGYEDLKKNIAKQQAEDARIKTSPAQYEIRMFIDRTNEAEEYFNKKEDKYFNEKMKEAIDFYMKVDRKDAKFDLSAYMDKFKKYKEIYNKKNNIVEDVDITDKSKSQPVGNKDEGITGPVHKKNIGKIVFRKVVIDRSLMNDEKIYSTDDFVPGDEIYARFFLEKGMNKYPLYDDKGGEHENGVEEGGEKKYVGYAMIFIDGKPALSPQRAFTTSKLKGVTDKYDSEHPMIPMTGQIYIINGGRGAADIDKDLAGVFATLSNGPHKAKVEFWLGTPEMHSKTAVATGEFVYNKKSLGVTFEALEAGMKNPELEAKMVKETVKMSKASNWKETFTKAKIASEDWQIRKNELTSAINGRTIDGFLYATWPDGHCSYQVFGFWQDFDGAGYQNSIKYYSTGSQTSCDCSK